MAEIDRREQRRADDQRRHDDLATAGLRLLLVVVALAASLALMVVQRRRATRWIVTGFAGVGASTVLALVMAGDYVADVVDPTDAGPLVLAVAGVALTVIAIAALQRQLARRLPGRRVRHGECPFCGYPTGRGDHCEGCGRDVVAPCAQCAAPRRVGAPHCATCGHA